MQAALAQNSALAMARGADWTSKLVGLEGLLSETSAGRKWEELLTRAQNDCTEAIDSLARLTGLLRDQAQVNLADARLSCLAYQCQAQLHTKASLAVS